MGSLIGGVGKYFWKSEKKSGKVGNISGKVEKFLEKLKLPASSLINATLHPWGHSFPPQMDRCIVQIQNWPLHFIFIFIFIAQEIEITVIMFNVCGPASNGVILGRLLAKLNNLPRCAETTRAVLRQLY